MKTHKNLYRLLAGTLMLLAILGSACSPAAPAVQPTQVPAPAAQVQPAPQQASFDLDAAVAKYITTIPDGFGLIDAAKLNEQLAVAQPFLLDLREPSEIATNGYIAGAVNIPIRSLAQNLDKLPAQDQPIVAYCGSGHRSALAMEALSVLGYTNVKSLKAGFGAWKTANLPVATGTISTGTAGNKPNIEAVQVAALDKYLSGIPDGFGVIAADKLKDQIASAKPFLLDVRETTELTKDGLIEGAVNVPIRTLTENLSKLPQDKTAPIVVYCGSGHRSALAMEALVNLGYTNVKSLGGGLASWTKAGFPTVQSGG